jgi:hypothetical protein
MVYTGEAEVYILIAVPNMLFPHEYCTTEESEQARVPLLPDCGGMQQPNLLYFLEKLTVLISSRSCLGVA